MEWLAELSQQLTEYIVLVVLVLLRYLIEKP